LNSFSQLHFDLLALPERNKRIERLHGYFQAIPDERDRHRAEQLLRNNARKRFIQYDELRSCASEYTGLPLWLIEECIQHTGNVTEAITLLVRSGKANGAIALHEIMQRLHIPEEISLQSKSHYIKSVWETLPAQTLYLFNKLITGSYRSPVSKTEVEQALQNNSSSSHARYTIKAVLLYASRSEYTFAVWKDDLLIPLVKTAAGIASDEHTKIRRYIVRNTREQFGPVVSVNPGLVYEVAFESVERAYRRKSGIKLISPWIVRRCDNASLDEVDQLENIYSYLEDNKC